MVEIRNARIYDTFMGYEDRGIMTVYLNLDYGGVLQNFGGYGLDRHNKNAPPRRLPTACFGLFVARVLEITGKREWKDVKGSYIRVESTRNDVIRIGHIIDDKWFEPKTELQALYDEKEKDNG